MKHKRLIMNAACALLLVGCSLTAYAFADGTDQKGTTDPAVTTPHMPPSHDGGGGTGSGSATIGPKPAKIDSSNQTGNSPNGGGKSAVAGSGGLKLSPKNLTQCQNRQAEINAIQARIITRTANQITLFNTTAQHVEGFVTTKSLTIPGYANLTGLLSTDQSVVTADLTSLKSNQTLDCAAADPSGSLSDFRAVVQNTFTDMQTYKSDLLKLITAVKAVTGNSQQPTDKTTNTQGSPTGVSEE